MTMFSKSTVNGLLVVAFVALVAAIWPCAYAHGASVSFQNGGTDPFVGGAYWGGEDTGVASHEFNGHRNSSEAAVGANSTGVIVRNLNRFDVTSMAGEYLSINSVTLRLNHLNHFGAANQTVQVYRVADANAGWAEGSTAAPPTGLSTWGYRNYNTVNWAGSAGLSTSGTDYVATLLASQAVGSGTIGNDIDFVLSGVNLTDLMDDWTTGTNAGLLLLPNHTTSEAWTEWH